jgi:hypothetical protein
LQEKLSFKEKQREKITSSLRESSFSFRLKMLILRLSFKLQLRRISKDSILLKERIRLYEKAISGLKGNSCDCAIQLIEKEIDGLFNIFFVTSLYPEIIDITFRVSSPSEFYYLCNLEKKLIYFQDNKI